MLDTFGMVVVDFLLTDKANQVRFFKETFLVANISPKIVFEILFLTLSSANVDFLDWKLWLRTYTTKKAFSTIKRVKLVVKKKFAAEAFDLEHEIFVIYVALFFVAYLSSILLNAIHLFRKPQIASLIAKEALTKIFDKYVNIADIFSPDLASKLFEHTGINKHAIKLVNGQQPPYGPIYSLEPVELETLKAYIETNLANGFIKLSKSPIGARIFFEQKSDVFFQLYINYRGFNNLTIKNRYLLPLVEESLDKLERAWEFTQLDFTGVYYWMRIRKGDK